MRIHTNASYDAMRGTVRGLPGVHFDALVEYGSRTHPRAFEVRLEGNGRRMNTGQRGAGEVQAATWDEWGAFLAALYEVDPEARCRAYYGAYDFHERTNHRFVDGLPADTHAQHRWNSVQTVTGSYVQRCGKCTAVLRTGGAAT